MVVFFDIDGTIVDNDTQIIPQSTVEAIDALTANGHIPVVNTGRPLSHVDPRVRKLHFGGWIGGCGMEVRLGDQWIYHTRPSLELCRFAVENANAHGMEALFEADDGSIAVAHPDSSHPVVRQEMTRMAAKGFGVYKIEDHPQFMKMITLDMPGCRREEYLKSIEPYFTGILRENTMIEHVLKGCSKSEGMRLLLEHLNVPAEETLAIGDSTNDLPMFAVANHTVCMGDGMDELKQAAEYITAPVLADGIAKALKHYGLI